MRKIRVTLRNISVHRATTKYFLARLFSKTRLKRKDFQAIARLAWAQEVSGSNPDAPTICLLIFNARVFDRLHLTRKDDFVGFPGSPQAFGGGHNGIFVAGIRPVMSYLEFTQDNEPGARTSVEMAPSALLQVALSSVAKRQSHAKRHESNRRNDQDRDTLANGPLSVLGARLCRAVTHRTALAERWRGPQEESREEK